MRIIFNKQLFWTCFFGILVLALLKQKQDNWFFVQTTVIADETLPDGVHFRHTVTRYLSLEETLVRVGAVLFVAFGMAFLADNYSFWRQTHKKQKL